MHSCEASGSPVVPAVPPASGPGLLLQLGRLVVRSRSPANVDRPKSKLASPSTSHHILTQPRSEEPKAPPALESALANHVQALWAEQIPICIEVLLAPDCQDCYATLNHVDAEATYDKSHAQQRGLLLERWTMRALVNKSHEGQAFITSQWLLNAVRSQLHFSQLSAWLQRLRCGREDDPTERRRKLSREKCNYKKIESNCDDGTNERNLYIIYSIKIPGESYRVSEFNRPPSDHVFPVTDIGNNIYLKVNLESLPRTESIPSVKCFCPKRRPSISEDLVGKLNDLTLSSKYQDCINTNASIGNGGRRLSIISNSETTEYLYSTSEETARGKRTDILDDRMHTPCSENGKHKCNCDDESDDLNKELNKKQETKKLDERRLKEIAKYKRRLRKEIKLKKLSDSTSSDGEGVKVKETHTSIPILQAARFDRFRAIGCYRNQTYLTLPASRIETKSPFIESSIVPPVEIKKTSTMATQTDDLSCQCGIRINLKCDGCSTIVRSEGNYNLSSIAKEMSNGSDDDISNCQNSDKCMEVNEKCEENGVRRKMEDEKSMMTKKLKCDIISSNSKKCDKNIVNNIVDDRCSVKDFINKNISLTKDDELIRRPKLRRLFPIVDRIERLVTDRMRERDGEREKEMEQLHLMDDDSVFCTTPKKLGTSNEGSHFSEPNTPNVNPNCLNLNAKDAELTKPEAKRQKTFSINEDDFVTYEKCEFGTFDRCEIDSPKENDYGVKYLDLKSIPNKSDVKNRQQHLSEIKIANCRNQKSGFNFNNISEKIERSPTERRRRLEFLQLTTSSPDDQEKIASTIKKSNDTHDDLIQNHNVPLNVQNQNFSNQNLSFLSFTPNLYQQSQGNQSQDVENQNSYPNQHNLKKHSSKAQHQTATQYDQDTAKYQDHCNKDPIAIDSPPHERPSQSSDDLQNQKGSDAQVPSPTEMDRFRWRFDSAASMVFHTKTGLPLTSSPAPLRRGNNCFDFDDSINGISGIKSALFHPCRPEAAPASPPAAPPPRPAPRLRAGPGAGLLGTFEESALKGRLEPVATVHGFTAELGASGAFCPPHKRLPVTVFFYAPGGTNAPYLAHINLGTGYRVPSSGTVQVSLFNPHGTLVKMFVVLYDLTSMPASARTFLRQRTVYMPACEPEPMRLQHKWLRYLIHLRFMTSKSGKLYLHTDIRILVSRKADLDTATAHSALFRSTNQSAATAQPTNRNEANDQTKCATNHSAGVSGSTNRGPNRVFGGCSEFDSEIQMCNGAKSPEICYEGQGVSYELRSFTYAPDNPKYSPR